MGEARQISVDSLLSPIPGKDPCGESLLYSDLYDKIVEARRADDLDLFQAGGGEEPKRSNWHEVEKLCRSALISHSKDLQLCVWITEAWFHLEKLPGLNRGLRLLSELLKGYWKELYPKIDGDDYDHRLGPIDWLNNKFPDELNLIQITSPLEREFPDYTYLDYLSAEVEVHPLKAVNDPAQEAKEQAQSLRAKIATSGHKTPTKFYRSLLKDLEKTTILIEEIEAVMQSHLTLHDVYLHMLEDKIDEVTAYVEKELRGRPMTEETVANFEEKNSTDSEERVSKTTTPPTRKVTPKTKISGAIKSRAEAYQMLEEAAAYLEKTEPHSPTPYLIRRAVTWGDLPLSQILPELINDPSLLAQVKGNLGLDENDEK